jgi:hypothetical protein
LNDEIPYEIERRPELSEENANLQPLRQISKMVPALGMITRVKAVFTGTEPVLITSAAITSSIWTSQGDARRVTPAQNTGQSPAPQT